MNRDTHLGHDLMRQMMASPPAVPKRPGKMVLDSTDDDTAGSTAADYADANIRLSAAAAIQEWVATPADDLDEGETNADRLLMMVVGIVDADKDGEVSDVEQAVADTVLDSMWDYLADKGVSDEDCDALLNQWDAAAADRIKDLLAEKLPSDDEDQADDIDSFAFDPDTDRPLFDSAGNLVTDAVYRKKVVVRGGKKVRINKRISGHVKLSAKQKIAVKKMQRKAHSASAVVKRMKSLRVRSRAGL